MTTLKQLREMVAGTLNSRKGGKVFRLIKDHRGYHIQDKDGVPSTKFFNAPHPAIKAHLKKYE